MEPFTGSYSADSNDSSSFSLVAAPVIFTLHHDPSLFAEIEQAKDSIEHVNYSKVRFLIKKKKCK